MTDDARRPTDEAAGDALALVRACADADENVRARAVDALENLGVPTGADVVELARTAETARGDAAYWAATLLGRLEAQAAPAAETLGRIVSVHADLAVRERAAWALGKIGRAAPGVRAALEKAAAGDRPRLARLARTALEQIKPAAN